MPAQQSPNRPHTKSPSARPTVRTPGTNDALNRVLTGTRRSWMLNVPPTQPTPRSKRPPQPPAPIQQHAQQQQHQEQAVAAPAQNVLPSNGNPNTDASNKRQAQPHRPRQSVLLSPAPSDEPSPAVSTTHEDSPNTAPASLREPRSMDDRSTPAANGNGNGNQLQLPVTDARFAVTSSSPEPAATQPDGAGADQTPGQIQSGHAARSLGERVSGSGAADTTRRDHPPLPSLRPSQDPQGTASGLQAVHADSWLDPDQVRSRQPPHRIPHQPAIPPPAGAQQQPGATHPSRIVAPSPPAHHSPDAVDEPSAKRRRTESATTTPNPPPGRAEDRELALQDEAKRIEQYMIREGGMDAFTKDAEQPRLQLLGGACKARDEFFVALHQLSCMWTGNPAGVRAVLARDSNVIEAGFYVVEMVLKKNALIHPRHLKWMSDFPRPLMTIMDAFRERRLYTRYSAAVYAVGSFLERAANSYSSLTQAMTGRGYPYLVDELVGQLDCRSSTLQYVLFTASRRRLGVPDGVLQQSLDQAFFRDQRNHQDQQNGAFLPMDPTRVVGELERRNLQLIQHYRNVVQKAHRMREEARRRSSIQLVAGEPVPVYQPIQSPVLVSSPSTANPPQLSAPSPTLRQQQAFTTYSPAGGAASATAPSPHLPHLHPARGATHPSPVVHSSVPQFPNPQAGQQFFANLPQQQQPLQQQQQQQQQPQPAIQNMDSQNSGTPQRTNPGPGRPSQQAQQANNNNASRQQQAAAGSWMAANNQMASPQIPVQPSPTLVGFGQQQPGFQQQASHLQDGQQSTPNLQGVHQQGVRIIQQQSFQMQPGQHQQVFQQQPGQQLSQRQQTRQNRASLQSQQRQYTAALAANNQQQANTNQSIANQHGQPRPATGQEVNQMVQQHQWYQQLELQQQQAQLAASHREPGIQGVPGPQAPGYAQQQRNPPSAMQKLPGSLPSQQLPAARSSVTFPVAQPHLRTPINPIPTPGVSPVAPQFPSRLRGRQQQPFGQQQQQQVLSPGLVLQNNRQSQQVVAAAMALYQNPHGARFPDTRLIPPLNQTIPLCDWPSDPSDKKAIMMSFHQAGAGSPPRKVRRPAPPAAGAGEPDERYYQAVQSLAFPPAFVHATQRVWKYSFAVTEEQFARRSQSVLQDAVGELAAGELPIVKLPVAVAEHFDGSLRWRVRTCRSPADRKPLAGVHEWVGLDTAWPEHISITFNEKTITVRRRTHNGRDLPSELTPVVRCGVNELIVTIPDSKKKTSEPFLLGVEMVETRSHSSTMADIRNNGVIPEEETLKKIKSRLLAASQDDDDSVTIVAKDLSVDLADPFTRVMFEIPARGVHCTHMECFDLEIWLDTRPFKPVKCPHSGFVQCDCRDRREPSVADKWKCPICNMDARPYSLRIDGFLVKVREQLAREGKLGAKSILVAADGTWQAVIEPDSDVDESEDGNIIQVDGSAATKPSPPAGPPKKPVEVIELLDD